MKKVTKTILVVAVTILVPVLAYVEVLREQAYIEYSSFARFDGLTSYYTRYKEWPKSADEFSKYAIYHVKNKPTKFWDVRIQNAVDRGVSLEVVSQDSNNFSCYIQGRHIFAVRYKVDVKRK